MGNVDDFRDHQKRLYKKIKITKMGAGRIELFSFKGAKTGYLDPKDDKFKLVGCPRKGINCIHILPEINRLYSESELARINKEYQKSVELLQKAYYKTLELKEPTCSNCVVLFQSTMNETLETMQKELQDISFGIFRKKRHQSTYSGLSKFLKKMNFFKVEDNNLLTKKISG